MSKFFLLLSLALCTAPLVASPDNGHPTFGTDAEAALAQAAREGKYVFVAFHAEWCLPCRWMAETTFTHPSVQAELAKHYVPVCADIDESEGFILYHSYDVKVLPTLLILDAAGEVVARYEESLGIVQLLEVLEEHATSLPHREVEATQVTAKATHTDHLPSAQNVVPASASRTNPESPSPEMERPDSAPEVASTPSEEPNTRSPENTVTSAGELAPPPAQGFAVQVGVYTRPENVRRKVAEIQAIGDHPVWQEVTDHNGTSVYKLLSGHFPDKNSAAAWRAVLARQHQPGYIRDLSRS